MTFPWQSYIHHLRLFTIGIWKVGLLPRARRLSSRVIENAPRLYQNACNYLFRLLLSSQIPLFCPSGLITLQPHLRTALSFDLLVLSHSFLLVKRSERPCETGSYHTYYDPAFNASSFLMWLHQRRIQHRAVEELKGAFTEMYPRAFKFGDPTHAHGSRS